MLTWHVRGPGFHPSIRKIRNRKKRKSWRFLTHLKMLKHLLFQGHRTEPPVSSLGSYRLMCSVAGRAALTSPVASENTVTENPAARSVMKQWVWSP